MEMSLKVFRDNYLETLLRFLWREWSALGVAGQNSTPLRHVVDPEALLLFTCSLGRYDQRLFDEVMDWLVKNGRFLSIQRIRNILHRERFHGGAVLSAVADWLSQREDPTKWKLLARMEASKDKHQALFHLPDGRPMPQLADNDATFLKHGFLRGSVTQRGYSQTFPADVVSCRFLGMRALFGVNARCDVLTYLALNGAGHPREVARELYYSQKAIHDVMTDMACSAVVQSSRGARERTFRIASGALPFLTGAGETPGWINWPILLSTAETIWRLTQELHTANNGALLETSEIMLTMKPLLERLTRSHWAPAIRITHPEQGIEQLHAFQTTFEKIAA